MALKSTDLDNAARDLKTVSAVSNSVDPDTSGSIDTYQTRLGDMSDTLNGRLRKIGYLPPIAYVGGISFTALDNTKTVDEDGTIYAPLPSSLPFTTSGAWLGDDDARFFVVQGVVFDEITDFVAAEFSTVADMALGSASNYPTTIDFADYVGRTVKTTSNNSISNAGPATYLISASDPGNLSSLVLGRRVGANHALVGGYYAVLEEGEELNPLQFGAVMGGSYDNHLVFAAMWPFKKPVKLNEGDLWVHDIPVENDITVYGSEHTFLLCDQDNSSVFLCDTLGANNNINRIHLRGFVGRTVAGVSGARFWKQTNREFYTAYATFENIKTYKEFEVTYDGFFIFGKWVRGRDAFRGSNVSGQDHKFISSQPEAFGQFPQSNICQVHGVSIFNSTSQDAAIDIAYGSAWDIAGCDFESFTGRAVRARGVIVVNVRDGCWFESIDADEIFRIESSPGPNVQPVRPFKLDGNRFDLGATDVQVLSAGGGCIATVTNNAFTAGDAGLVLTNLSALREFHGNELISIANPDFYQDTKAVRSLLQLDSSCVNTPGTANINLLPFGRSGFTAAMLSASGLSSGPADTASTIGLSNAVRFRLGGGNNLVYYTLPAPIVKYIADNLAGETLTMSIMGYGEDATAPGIGITAAIWNVAPSGSNFSSVTHSQGFDSDNVDLGVSTSHYTVTGIEAELHIGVYAGGAAPNDWCDIETMELVIGEHYPAFVLS